MTIRIPDDLLEDLQRLADTMALDRPRPSLSAVIVWCIRHGIETQHLGTRSTDHGRRTRSRQDARTDNMEAEILDLCDHPSSEIKRLPTGAVVCGRCGKPRR